MRRLGRIAALGVVLLALVVGFGQAADAPSIDGNWKVVIQTPAQNLPFFLIKAEDKKGEPTIELVTANPQFKGATIKDVKFKDGAYLFTIKGGFGEFQFKFQKPKDAKAKELLGFLSVNGNNILSKLERTDAKELDEPPAPVEGAQEYFKAAFQTRDAKEKEKLLKELVAKHENDVLGWNIRQSLLEVLPANGASETDIKALAEKIIQFADGYGPETKNLALRGVAQKLVATKKLPELALSYARLAEKSLPKDATPGQTIAVLKPLLSALKLADKKDEIKDVTERVAGLEKALDEEFEKTAVPFKTEEFTRDAAKTRVVLLELFTGAQCPPCVAADVAFDAALKTYKPKDVVLLQYHLHIPGPDPLTNEDTEKRSKYYGIQGVPSFYPNGGNDLGIGGPKGNGKTAFDTLVKAIKEPLDSEDAAKLKVTAEKKDDNIVITANVSDLKDAGEDTKLRFALVEESVRYPGNNGQRFHHQVVRAMPGGADGFTLKEAKTKQEVKVNLADLKKELSEYLVKANEKRPFLNEDRPLELKHLKVVAFIQNDKSKEILQAAQVDVK